MRKQGFTLIELMIVVAIIAIIAAIAIPSLLNARKAGNEASAISSLRTLVTVNEQYRTRFQTYADTLGRLQSEGYIDNVLGSGLKSGYTFVYPSAGGTFTAITANTWSCQANATTQGTTGDRHFYSDHSGVIRFDPAAAATDVSPAID